MTAETIIKELDLKAHPEGGYFKETYRSQASMELFNYAGERSFSTGIYYLLLQGKISAFHKIKQDEMWHFYKGSSLELHIISPDGIYQRVIVGNQLEHGEVPQFVVRGGDYFAARVCLGGDYSLVGCTVAPGFDFKDFIMPSRSELIQHFPKHETIITELTHS